MPELKKKFNFSFSAKSDIGLIRRENQDSFGKFPENNTNLDSPRGQMFIVADGMGGHKGGKEASSIAVNVVNSEYFASTYEESVALREAIEKANSTIFNKSGVRSEFGRMGTTCSVLVLKGDKGIIGHVGDSRIYKIENNFIEQLTSDHTKVQEMLREGILSPEEARNYSSKSVLARALGVDETVKVDIIDDIRLKRRQSYILCSDGLAKVSKGEILNIVSNNSPSDACDILVDLANERGGKDNTTVIVIKIDPDPLAKVPAAKPVKKTLKKKVKRRSGLSFKNSKGWVPVILIFFVVIVLLLIEYHESIFSFYPVKTVKQNAANMTAETVNKNKPTIDLDYTDKKLLAEAEHSLKNKDYDNAYIIYKSLLSNESLRKAVLQGIDQIATAYIKTADNFKNDKNFEDALKYYNKAETIQPGNKEIKNLIKFCTDQINNEESPQEYSSAQNAPPPEAAAGSRFTISRFDLRGWTYPAMNKNECTVNSNEINFTGTLSERFIIYNQDVFDVTVSASAEINNPNSTIGLIIGYISPLDYYLFKYRDGGNYTLLRIQENEIKKLLVVKPKDSGKADLRKMKIIYAKNLISIYDQNDLVGSYKSVFGIFGKAGIYIDKNSSAKFENIFISGNKELN